MKEAKPLSEISVVGQLRLNFVRSDQAVIFRQGPRFIYLAGASDSWQAVAVPQSEFDFHVDPLSAGPRDPVCPQPVVLVRS